MEIARLGIYQDFFSSLLPLHLCGAFKCVLYQVFNPFSASPRLLRNWLVNQQLDKLFFDFFFYFASPATETVMIEHNFVNLHSVPFLVCQLFSSRALSSSHRQLLTTFRRKWQLLGPLENLRFFFFFICCFFPSQIIHDWNHLFVSSVSITSACLSFRKASRRKSFGLYLPRNDGLFGNLRNVPHS